jgi:tripeptidyl-peptidase-1
VTAVGGTYKVPEVAISFSGGGFSNYFAQPSYQSAAVANYLKTFTSYSTYFNKYVGLFSFSSPIQYSPGEHRTGRAYPDIAAQADNFQVYISGYVNSVAGTSAASPTAAAVISLVNDYRISLGKAPLGFLK